VPGRLNHSGIADQDDLIDGLRQGAGEVDLIDADSTEKSAVTKMQAPLATATSWRGSRRRPTRSVASAAIQIEQFKAEPA
jgi:hypothetical protein